MGWTFYNATGQRLQTSATVLATKAEMETGTALTSFVTPGRTQHHPGVAKVTCKFETVGTHAIITSYNMATVSDGGALGDSDVSFTTNFANTNYIFAGGADQNQLVSVTDASAAVGGHCGYCRL